MPPRVQEKITLPRGTKVPDHIAIIPDGNRRWARARGVHTLKGHKRGFERAVEVSRAARDLGVHTVTLWGFSTENWDRSPSEINYLMKLYKKMLNDYIKEAHENKVKIVHLGRKDRLPQFLLDRIQKAEEETGHYRKHIMNIALDYGGHDDIIRAVKRMIAAGISEDLVSKQLFERYLDTHGQPYPYVDLMIRTSGEQRTSGLLLWQAEYCEYYWEEGHFPDFSPDKLREAILDYSRRRRRFGGNDEVKHFTFKPEVAANLEVNWWRLQNIPQGQAFGDFVIEYLSEQYGFSKSLAKQAAKHMIDAVVHGDSGEWVKAKKPLAEFFSLVKDHLKLAFEPEILTSLQIKFWKEIGDKRDIRTTGSVEETARELYAEQFRISTFQAAKVAHLRVLASVERNLARDGMGEHHWEQAEQYLQMYYQALKERIA